MPSADRGHPLFAWAYDRLTAQAEERWLAPSRRALIAACRGRVLELGIGTGASLVLWADAVQTGQVTALTAIEPDPYMRQRAANKAALLNLPLHMVPASAERLPFADATFDSVAAFLVLCTVAEPDRVLAEAYRVLRPGGLLAFLEHVRGEGRAARWQHRLSGAWSRLAAGCRLDRDTAAAVERAGFIEAQVTHRRLPFPFYRLIAGTARRPPD